jgi:hypothetical protein
VAVAALALAPVTAAIGLGAAALPASASSAPRAVDPPITITAGGDRLNDESVGGLNGAHFTVPGTDQGGCTTATLDAVAGRCRVDAPDNGSRTVTLDGAPGGWFLNPYLGVGTTDDPGQRAGYSSMATGTISAAGVNMPIPNPGATGSNTARGSLWALSRTDVGEPNRCGLRVALLFDLSSSVGGYLPTLQTAGNDFIQALQGTPSEVAAYTFGTFAPVNQTNNSNYPLTPLTDPTAVTGLTDHIRDFSIEGGQYTNWDSGLWQIANSDAGYDVAIVLTDGDPTVYGPAGSGQSFPVRTRFVDVENGIFSANALKHRGTGVLAVGINADRDGSIDNLRAISGPDEGIDYFPTTWGGLDGVVRNLALKSCAGTVNVTKRVIPHNEPGNTDAALPAPGWTMHATGPTVTPPSRVTNETGAASFGTSSPSEDVGITEDVNSGYTHFPVDGDNGVCRDSRGDPVGVTNHPSPPPGFTVTTHSDDIINCEIFNQSSDDSHDPASVVVHKRWVIDGVRESENNQDPNFQANLDLSPAYNGEPATWGEERFGYTPGESVTIGERDVRIPAGCTSTSPGRGSHALAEGRNEFTITNTVSCEAGTKLTLVKKIESPFAHARTAPLTAWTLTARRAPGVSPVLNGSTGVTGRAEPRRRYLLAESHVPGYQHTIDRDTRLVPGATGSWHCVDNLPTGSGLEDFDGGTGTVAVRPGQHVTCTAVNRLTRRIPVGPAATGGGPVPAGTFAPAAAGGLTLLAGIVLGALGLRSRRSRRIGTGG